MQTHTPTYDEALSLFKEFNQSESLLKHAYTVEGVMRYMAQKLGEDEEKWGIVGLIDELTGLITAVAIIRPSKSVSDLEAKSVMKKWKDKSFAAGVNRSVIEKGTAMLGVELKDLVTDTIMGMRQVADRIGL